MRLLIDKHLVTRLSRARRAFLPTTLASSIPIALRSLVPPTPSHSLPCSYLAIMLAATPIYYQPYHTFLPSRPSPLSERAVNAVPRTFAFSMATSTSDGKKPLIAPQRAFKQNPIMQTRDAATKRRRDMFFKRVQRDREEKKWDARGEQV